MTDKQCAAWGAYSRIEFYDANFHHHDCRPALWCIRRTGMGYTNPYPRTDSALVPPPETPMEDYIF